VTDKSFFDQIDEKLQEFDRAIEAAEEVLDGMKAQRALVVTMRETMLGIEANQALYQGKIEEYHREQS
jgi:hypothetical protein